VVAFEDEGLEKAILALAGDPTDVSTSGER
jgi:hypothetical protein